MFMNIAYHTPSRLNAIQAPTHLQVVDIGQATSDKQRWCGMVEAGLLALLCYLRFILASAEG